MIVYNVLSIVISILSLLLAVLSLSISVVVKLYYYDKLDAKLGKVDPYEKYRGSDGLLTNRAVKEVSKR
jgi:hypothetical protein